MNPEYEYMLLILALLILALWPYSLGDSSE